MNSVGRLLRRAAAWWAVFTVLFFATFPLWGRLSVRVLAAVLGALNNFGSGR